MASETGLTKKVTTDPRKRKRKWKRLEGKRPKERRRGGRKSEQEEKHGKRKRSPAPPPKILEHVYAYVGLEIQNLQLR